jgi:hypothetical protein
MDFNREKQRYRLAIFNKVRDAGPALKRVKKDYDTIQTWTPGDGEFERTYLDKNLGGRDIGALCDYFNNYHIGALEHIVSKRFEIGYHIYGDITRQAMLGENTNSMRVPVTWDTLDVEVEVYRGEGLRLEQTALARTAAESGIRNRQDITKFTGWNPDITRNMGDARLAELQELLKVTAVNQNKFTRLVKGFLMFLYLKESGSTRVVKNIQNVILSGPMATLQSFGQPGRAYVHNSNPTSDAYSLTLSLMGEAFPPSFIQSHVTVPSDGEHVFLVACGGNVNPSVSIMLSHNMVLASIFRYASDVGVSSQLQGALIAACSLKENRYFSKIGLPAVVDYCDLLMSQFVIHDLQENQKTFLSGNMAVAVGRIHQMLCFATAKDVITSAECSTRSGYDWRGSVISFLSQQESRIARLGTYFTDIKIMDCVPEFKWLSYMDEADISDISSLSILESLWLCDRTKKISDNGSIMHLKCGMHDLTDAKDSLSVLKKEINTSGILLQLDKLPHGDFTVESSSIRTLSHRVPRQVNRIVQVVNMAVSCKVKLDQYVPVRKQRHGSDASSRPSYSHRQQSSSATGQLSTVPFLGEADSNGELTPPKIGSPPKFVAMPARLATEITGKESTGVGQKQANWDTFKRLQSRLGTKETITKLKELGLNDGMTDAEVAISVRNQIQNGKAIADRKLMELVLHHTLMNSGLNSKETKYIEDIVNEFRILKKVAGLGLDEIANCIFSTEKSSLVHRIDSDNHTIKEVMQHISDNRSETFYEGTIRSSMELLGKDWEGNVEGAPREALAHVANSKSWIDFCKSMNIPQEVDVIGRQAYLGLALLMSRCTELELRDMPNLYKWVSDTSVSFMHPDIKPSELKPDPPQTRDFREKATSMGKRKYNEGDGKWLDLAIITERKIFNYEGLRKLQKEFYMSNKDLYIMKNRYWQTEETK